MTKIRRKIYEIKWYWAKGIHNEYPKCCITWFLVRHFSGWVTLISQPWSYPIWNRLTIHRAPRNQYIHCPLCVIRNHSIEMHYCPDECPDK